MKLLTLFLLLSITVSCLAQRDKRDFNRQKPNLEQLSKQPLGGMAQYILASNVESTYDKKARAKVGGVFDVVNSAKGSCGDGCTVEGMVKWLDRQTSARVNWGNVCPLLESISKLEEVEGVRWTGLAEEGRSFRTDVVCDNHELFGPEGIIDKKLLQDTCYLDEGQLKGYDSKTVDEKRDFVESNLPSFDSRVKKCFSDLFCIEPSRHSLSKPLQIIKGVRGEIVVMKNHQVVYPDISVSQEDNHSRQASE